MKNKILNIIIVTLLLSSCNESFLNVSPDTSLTSATFYKTETHFKQALTAAYQPLRTLVFDAIFMDEMRSDNTFYTYYAGDRGPYLYNEVIALFLEDETNGHVSSRYNAGFVGISRVNAILSKIDEVDFSDEIKNKIKGEASFLRAYYYYDLVQHYGGVPLHLEEVKTADEAFLPRSSVEEVYNQIIIDLETAIAILPIADNFPQSGRATKGAAKMLLAYTYMSKPNKEYSKAETQLKDITNMNYSLYDNYSDAFNPSNENGKESIFEIQYKDGDAGQQNDYIWRFIPKCDNTEFLMGVRGNNYAYTSGGWNVPTQEMVDSYENGDLRLNASIAVVEGTQNGDNFFAEAVKEIVNYTPTDGKAYHYFINKFYHPPYEKEFNTGTNWPIFRYSDALLLLAECLVEQNKNEEALPYLNQVRRRAGLPNQNLATKENIANERRHELAFENHRWTDLIRTGKAVEIMNANGEIMRSLYGFVLPIAFNVTNDKLIYPIPYRELQINELLSQNPGY
jgi:hypothetical protein